jgi:hypothetical protein
LLPAVFGLAPARVDIFDTISEFRETSGICGFGVGFAVGGGCEGVAFAAGGGLGGEIFDFATVAAGFWGVLVCGVEGGGFEARIVGDGLEDLAASSGVGIGF